ncbi:MAG: hypothetical protein ABIJ30_10595 [bacterium]
MKTTWIVILIPMLILSCAENRTVVKKDAKPVQPQVAEKAFEELDTETGDRNNTVRNDLA